MIYLQCCPTDTRQREEVSSLSEIIISLPTGIIAYADHEINMQVIPKQIKKSKLSPWLMPCFQKMAQLIGLLSLVGIHPWLLLVLRCLTLSDILTTSQKRV